MTARLRALPTPEGVLVAAHYSPLRPTGGGAVIVPSVGREAALMQAGVIHLARRLAQSGTHVLIIHPTGTDQSYGSLRHPHLIDGWRASVRRALDELGALGVARRSVVACRLGALLLGDVLGGADEGGADEVVLWSPAISGKRVVRELRLLSVSGAVVDNDGDEVNVGGFGYSPELLGALCGERLDTDRIALCGRVLVVDDERRPVDDGALAALAARAGHFTHRRVEDIAGWADVDPAVSQLPHHSIATIVDWATEPVLTNAGVVAPRPPAPANALPGVETNEEFVAIGEPALAGVLVRGDGDVRHRAALLLASTSGPGRRFLEFARHEAVLGRGSLRFDVAGTGWSDPPLDGRPTFSYDERNVDDVVAAAAALRAAVDGPIVAVGFCAGARALLAAAPRAGIDVVVAINVELFEPMRRAEPPARPPLGGLARSLDRVRRAVRGLHSTSDALSPFRRGGPQVVLVFDESEPSRRFLSLLPRGRAALAGRDPHVRIRTHRGLGHNLEGSGAYEVFADITEELLRIDKAESWIGQSRPVLISRRARRRGRRAARLGAGPRLSGVTG